MAGTLQPFGDDRNDVRIGNIVTVAGLGLRVRTPVPREEESLAQIPEVP